MEKSLNFFYLMNKNNILDHTQAHNSASVVSTFGRSMPIGDIKWTVSSSSSLFIGGYCTFSNHPHEMTQQAQLLPFYSLNYVNVIIDRRWADNAHCSIYRLPSHRKNHN